jgi:hypothetical protein
VKDETKKLAFWLLPAEPARASFKGLVNDLAARYDAPPFEAHLTLFAGAFDEAFNFAQLDDFQMPAQIVLGIESVQHSEQYTKTLFIRFHPQPELSALRRSMAEIVGGKISDDFDPHLSLIYKTMPPNERAELAKNVQLPFDSVRFDGVKAISTPAEIESAAEVKAWQTLWERPLA